jgi:murein DD-endopeptidase MepM/ murein hydrolase activator NlpD
VKQPRAADIPLVRGKVITSYGAKTNGKANDGINLAVPEGTPVGGRGRRRRLFRNELKGYGNCLVRHSTVTSPHMPMRVN